VELLTALYAVIKPALLDAYRATWRRPTPGGPADAPLPAFIIQEEEEMIQWGQAALQALLSTDEARETATAWEAHLRAYLRSLGRNSGSRARRPDADGRHRGR
jgi:hypothetical protein